MAELKIRDVPESKKEKLKELARLNGFKSLNQYLKFVLCELAEEKEIRESQKIHIQQEQVLVDALEKNTKTLNKILDVINGEEEF